MADTPVKVDLKSMIAKETPKIIDAQKSSGAKVHYNGVELYDSTDTLIGFGSVYADDIEPVQSYIFVPAVNAYAHFLLYDSESSLAEIGSINNYYETFVTEGGELVSNYPNQLIYLEGCEGIDGPNGKWYKSGDDPIVETTVGYYHQNTPDEACTFYEKSHPRLVFKLTEVSPKDLPFGKKLNMPVKIKPYEQ